MNTTRPNILLIISDQHSGLITTQAGYPHITTPGIDRLASQGTSYTRSYSANPLCVPERAALMTGMMPSKSWPHLCDYPCISTILGQADYQTVYFGKWHVGYSKMDEVAELRNEITALSEHIDAVETALNELNTELNRQLFKLAQNINKTSEILTRVITLQTSHGGRQ